jgi:hypothetical protein
VLNHVQQKNLRIELLCDVESVAERFVGILRHFYRDKYSGWFEHGFFSCSLSKWMMK